MSQLPCDRCSPPARRRSHRYSCVDQSAQHIGQLCHTCDSISVPRGVASHDNSSPCCACAVRVFASSSDCVGAVGGQVRAPYAIQGCVTNVCYLLHMLEQVVARGVHGRHGQKGSRASQSRPDGRGRLYGSPTESMGGVARLDDSFAAVARLEKVAAWMPYRLHGQRDQKRRQLHSSQ